MRIYRKMILFDFKCSAGHVSEHLVHRTTEKVTCPVCHTDAVKQLAAPRSKLEGITGDFPGAYAKWERNHRQALDVAKSKSYYEG